MYLAFSDRQQFNRQYSQVILKLETSDQPVNLPLPSNSQLLASQSIIDHPQRNAICCCQSCIICRPASSTRRPCFLALRIHQYSFIHFPESSISNVTSFFIHVNCTPPMPTFSSQASIKPRQPLCTFCFIARKKQVLVLI